MEEAFLLADKVGRHHINQHTADLTLHPPESYFFVQDFLILSCALLYTLCYLFYIARTFSDRYCAGTPLYLAGNLAYELYYALVMPRSALERVGFLVWFACDISFAAVVLWRGHRVGQRGRLARQLVATTLAGMAVLKACGRYWPDDMETVVAFWSGMLLELPIGWGSIYLLLQRKDTRGQSLEIWITRFLGCIAAFAVFGWRYLNAPQNWAYVGSAWSIMLMAATLLPETVYPFVYVWAHRKERVMGKVKTA